MTILERQMALMDRHGLRLRPDELFGYEAGQPGNGPQYQKAYQKKVSSHRKAALAAMMKAPKGKVGLVAKAYAEKHGLNSHTVRGWYRIVSNGHR